MQLLCPKCGVAIPGVDLDLGRGIGVCRPCGEIVPLPAAPPAPLAYVDDAPIVRYRPENFRFDETSTETSYRAAIPPRRLAVVPRLFFTLFWDAFMVMWYAIAIAGGVWPMAIFGLLHLGVGVWMTYGVLVALFNTSRLTIEGGRVRFVNGPVPTRGRLDVAISEVDAFVIEAKVSSSRNSSTTNYQLRVNLANGTTKNLGPPMDDNQGIEYAADRFNDELARAKRAPPVLPYRG